MATPSARSTDSAATLSYTAEDSANKSTNVTTDGASDTKISERKKPSKPTPTRSQRPTKSIAA